MSARLSWCTIEKMEPPMRFFLLSLSLWASGQLHANTPLLTDTNSVYLLPMTCSELLPNSDPFLKFLDSVARGNLGGDPAMATQIFRVLGLRNRLAELIGGKREKNPADTLIQKTLCFYRQNKDPLRPVAFDDNDFLAFLKQSLAELENRIVSAVDQKQQERFRLEEFSRRLELNRDREEVLRNAADAEAERKFQAVSEAAKKKIFGR